MPAILWLFAIFYIAICSVFIMQLRAQVKTKVRTESAATSAYVLRCALTGFVYAGLTLVSADHYLYVMASWALNLLLFVVLVVIGTILIKWEPMQW